MLRTLIAIWLTLGQVAWAAPLKPCTLVLRLLGGVRVEFTHQADGPSMRYYRENESSHEEVIPSWWIRWRTKYADKALAKAQNRFDQDPERANSHRVLATALKRALSWRGVTSQVVRQESGAYLVKFLSHDGKHPDTSWLVATTEFLATPTGRDGKSTAFRFDTEIAMRNTDAYTIGEDGARAFEAGEMPASNRGGFGPGTRAAHELFHWMQDQLRLAENPEAWPSHFVLGPMDRPLALTSGVEDGNPFNRDAATRIDEQYRLKHGYMIEESGNHGFQSVLEREVFEGLLAQTTPETLQKNPGENPSITSAAIHALNLFAVQKVFAETSVSVYDRLLTSPVPLKVTTANDGIQITDAEGYAIRVATTEPDALLKKFRDNPAVQHQELERGRRRVSEEQQKLAIELAKTKAAIAPFLTLFPADRQWPGIEKADGTEYTMGEVAAWAAKP